MNLVFAGVDGKVTQAIDLTGLVTSPDLSRDPTAPGVLMLNARKADGGLSTQWYRLSRDTLELEVFREGLSLFQVDNRISPDGKLLAYTK